MKKNSFIAKFIHFYYGNLLNVKDDIFELWDAIIDLLSPILRIILFPIKILRRIIRAVLPIAIIYISTRTIYLTKEELGDFGRDRKNGSYVLKKWYEEKCKEEAEDK